MSSSCTSGSRRMSRAADDTSWPRRLPGCAARLRTVAVGREADGGHQASEQLRLLAVAKQPLGPARP